MLGNEFASILIAITVVGSPAFAALLTATISEENRTMIALNGEIGVGDSDKLKEIIKTVARQSG
jgi:hypothetical protein